MRFYTRFKFPLRIEKMLFILKFLLETNRIHYKFTIFILQGEKKP